MGVNLRSVNALPATTPEITLTSERREKTCSVFAGMLIAIELLRLLKCAQSIQKTGFHTEQIPFDTTEVISVGATATTHDVSAIKRV